MLLRGEPFRKGRLLADDALLDIVVLVGAHRHLVERQVRDRGERLLEGSDRDLLVGFRRAHLVLQVRDAGLQLIGGGGVLLLHRLADLFREAVALFLALLGAADAVAAAIVESEYPGHRLLDGQPVPAALLQALLEGLGIVADPADVVHGRSLGT